MIKWVLGVPVGLFLLFIAFGFAVSTPATKAIHNAKWAVKDQLRDGSSAEFRNVAAYRDPSGKLSVCGEVNARNGFGGMAGYTRFYYVDGGSAVTEDASSGPVMDQLWKNGGCDGTPLARTD
jgi:hypothetical protein